MRAIQIARAVYRIYRVESGPIEALHLVGEVHRVERDWRAARAQFKRTYTDVSLAWCVRGDARRVHIDEAVTLEPLPGLFRSLQKACEALL